MHKSISFFLKYFAFWVLFFFFTRAYFEINYFKEFSQIPFSEILKTFLFGVLMDMSMAGYFCVLPFLYFIGTWLFQKKDISLNPIKYYSHVVIFLSAIFAVADVNIYREWGTKLNYKAIALLFESPKETIASTTSSPIFQNILGLILLSTIGILFYHWIFRTRITHIKNTHFALRLTLSILILAFTFLAIRGGVGIAPMNPSKVYFSQKQILNIAAINTNWFLLSSAIRKRKITKNPYVYFRSDQAKAIKNTLFRKDDTQAPILNTEKPNIVLIILESFTADVIAELGSEKGVTPNISKLIQEGVLFSNIYSASDRTDKGIVAILSGFPSQATESIIKEDDKQMKLPSISKSLKAAGYHTSFFYGGDLDFSNFQSYIINHGFQKITDINNIKTNEEITKWGVADNVTFNEQLSFINKEKQPFFSTILTLSNHEPFYLKGNYKFGKKTVSDQFRSTSFFTDSILYDYIQKAKKQAWYQNTLFVVVADHGHRLPTEKNEIFAPGRYHIPLLLFGGALKQEFKNYRVEKVGNQIDIPTILLSQLNLNADDFAYSKNLLSPKTKGFAFYSWNNGFGFINENRHAISFDPIGKHLIYEDNFKSKAERNESEQNAKAIMQSVFSDYMNY